LTPAEFDRMQRQLWKDSDVEFGVMEWVASLPSSGFNGVETEKGRGVPAAFTSWRAPEGWPDADLFLSVAHGRWETVLTAPAAGDTIRTLNGGEVIRIAPVRRKEFRDQRGRPYGVTEVVVYLPRSYSNPPGLPARYQYHLTAEYIDRAPTSVYRTTQNMDPGTLSMNLTDDKARPGRLKGWRLQVRPFHTAYFRAVSLQPK
jgi:hypothetical protein